jgi:hypothetical protein
MPPHRRLHERRLVLPELRAALDIGEEEGYNPGWQIHASYEL